MSFACGAWAPSLCTHLTLVAWHSKVAGDEALPDCPNQTAAASDSTDIMSWTLDETAVSLQ